MFSPKFLYVFLIATPLSPVTSQDCGELTQDRMLKCAIDLMAAETSSKLNNEQKCRQMQLEVKCMKNITDQCQDSASSNDVFRSLMAETPGVVDLVNNQCSDFNPCDYGEELLDDCIDMAIAGLAEQGTPKQMCKSVDGQLSCIENVIFLCQEVINPFQKIQWIERRQRFMKSCGKYFKGRN